MWSDLIGDLLSPPACAACDARIRSRTAFCPTCAATVLLDPGGGEGPLALGLFGGALATAIRRMKYDDRPDLARPLGALLATRCRGAHVAADVVVPIPLHPSRRAARGYNQAALLARGPASQIGARFAPLALARITDTPHQAELGRDARALNVAGAFRVRDRARIERERVLLVDDVLTTGATLEAAAAALLEAGAREVRMAVVARTPSSHFSTPLDG
jgi:ComF family protein